MTKAERAAWIAAELERLFPRPQIPLDHKDSYTLLVAVLLSAQCTDIRVNQVTPKLFARADNPADMALVPVEEIQAIIRPCGLAPAKARGISGLSKIIMEKHAAKCPARWRSWKRCPASATRPPPSSWCRLSASRPFRWIRTSTAWPSAGS